MTGLAARLAAALAFLPAFAAPLPAQDIAFAMRSVVSVLPVWPGRPPDLAEPEGSGVVVADGRRIITADHVIRDARIIHIRTFDGRIIAARLAGRDARTDLAVLEIDTVLAPLAFDGDPPLGARVCALGNMFGLGLSVSCGTVSALRRTAVGFNEIEDFVQTDAVVNPGASGGALINEGGGLVGVLSAIYTKQTDANIGVNFAVSAPLAQKVLEQIMARGEVRWRLGGATLMGVPARGETGRQAARIVALAAEGPEQAAGLQPGDVMLSAGGRQIRGPEDYASALARAVPGARIPVTFERNGVERSAELRMPQ